MATRTPSAFNRRNRSIVAAVSCSRSDSVISRTRQAGSRAVLASAAETNSGRSVRWSWRADRFTLTVSARPAPRRLFHSPT